MKKIFFTALTLIFTMSLCFSQDIITIKTSEDIQAKVIEITTSEIKYKRFDNINGPTYTILKSDVVIIRYENGTKDIFNEEKKNEFVPNSSMVTSERTFYVEKTPDGFEQPIIDKLVELNKKITAKQENSDYTIQCIISKTGMGRAKGSIAIVETKTGNLLLKSELVNGQTSAFNGYANPKMITMKKIAEDYLLELLSQLKIKK